MKFWASAAAALAVALALPDAAHAIGTAAGTTISNRTTVRWDDGAATRDTTTTGVVGSSDTNVTAVFGETIPNVGNQTFGVGETATFTYQIMNNGNTSDSFHVWISDSFFGGGATAWTVTLFVGSQSTTLRNDTKPTALVAADAVFSCSVQIVSSSNPANSPDGSFCTFTIQVASNSGPASTQYTGDNGTIYSVGGGRQNDTAQATIAGATITLAKVITSVTRGGSASLPTPGATLTYQLTYNNTGSGAADSVVVYDTIPTNTRADSMSSSISTLGASATFANDSGTSGWQAQFSTVASPNHAYNSTDFVTLVGNEGTLGNATVVRWRRQSVPSAENATIRFRVTIN